MPLTSGDLIGGSHLDETSFLSAVVHDNAVQIYFDTGDGLGRRELSLNLRVSRTEYIGANAWLREKVLDGSIGEGTNYPVIFNLTGLQDVTDLWPTDFDIPIWRNGWRLYTPAPHIVIPGLGQEPPASSGDLPAIFHGPDTMEAWSWLPTGLESSGGEQPGYWWRETRIHELDLLTHTVGVVGSLGIHNGMLFRKTSIDPHTWAAVELAAHEHSDAYAVAYYKGVAPPTGATVSYDGVAFTVSTGVLLEQPLPTNDANIYETSIRATYTPTGWVAAFGSWFLEYEGSTLVTVNPPGYSADGEDWHTLQEPEDIYFRFWDDDTQGYHTVSLGPAADTLLATFTIANPLDLDTPTPTRIDANGVAGHYRTDFREYRILYADTEPPHLLSQANTWAKIFYSLATEPARVGSDRYVHFLSVDRGRGSLTICRGQEPQVGDTRAKIWGSRTPAEPASYTSGFSLAFHPDALPVNPCVIEIWGVR